MKIVMNILILVTIMNCNSQNKVKQKKTMKTFDIQSFDKGNINSTSKIIELDNGNKILQFGNSKNGYIEYYTFKDKIFKDYYTYYPSGKLNSKGKVFFNDFRIGIWKEYDEQGNLIKEEDLDKPFTYSWEDVKKYLKAHHVEDIKRNVIGITRWSDEDETTWTLEFNGKYKDIEGRFVITLNGKTGEELEVKLFKGKDALGETGTIAVYDTIYPNITKKQKLKSTQK